MGRYELHQPIASGGMATVHLGRLRGQAGFSRIVAIKRLHTSFGETPALVATLLDEARLCSRIQHPNVVPTLDMVAEDDELLLVLDYVHGETLARLLGGADEPLPLAVVNAVMSGALHGLHAAHEATGETGEALGIVHRDVSPQNIMVGRDGLARVLDFGVAKARGRMQTTREGQVKGKLAYMSPEQIRGGDLDRRSDVFAAGVVLWEALTRRRLFRGDNEGQVLHAILTAEIEPPSRHRPGLDPSYDALVLRALARNPEARFATAEQLALELEALGPLATASEVGAWVANIAGPALAERAALVSALERGDDAPAISASDPDAPTRTATAQALSPASEEVTGSAQGIPVVREPSSPRAHLAWLGLVAAGAIATGFWWQTLPEPALLTTRVEVPQIAPAAIELEVLTTPPGAMVTLLGRSHGPTPVTVAVPKGEAALELQLAMDGHEPATREVKPDKDQRLEIALAPRAIAGPSARPPAVAPPAPSVAPSAAPKPGSPFYRFD
ncbi:MAG: protein kinase [Polyangiaceae bacterium]